jgi:hypothetical protein
MSIDLEIEWFLNKAPRAFRANTFNVIGRGALGHVFVVHRTTTAVLWSLGEGRAIQRQSIMGAGTLFPGLSISFLSNALAG